MSFELSGKSDEQLLGELLLRALHGFDARVLVLLVERLADASFCERLHARDDALGRYGLGPLHLRLATGLGQKLFLRRDELANALVGNAERVEHIGLTHLERATLDHHDRVIGRRDDQLQIAVAELLERRVEYPLILDTADANAADQTREWDSRGVQRVRRRDEREDVRVILLVGGDDVDEDLHFVLESFREQRADRSVDDPCRKDFSVVRSTLALDEAAGNLASRVGLFLILDREREERQRALLITHRHCGEDHGVSELDDGRASGLLRHTARLDAETTTGEGPFNVMHHYVTPQ